MSRSPILRENLLLRQVYLSSLRQAILDNVNIVENLKTLNDYNHLLSPQSGPQQTEMETTEMATATAATVVLGYL